MIKKMIILSTLVSTLLVAETMKEKGFFVGIDISHNQTDMSYRKSSSIPAYNVYNNIATYYPVSIKVGFQYYFAKIYLRFSDPITISDTTRDAYSIKTKVYELNVDYIPILYRNKDKEWTIKGVLGIASGVNASKLIEYDKRLFDPMNTDGTVDTGSQYNMNLGYNIGLINEFDSGLNIELGYRFRSGLALEYFDTDQSGNRSNEATFKLRTKEFYLGVNYLF